MPFMQSNTHPTPPHIVFLPTHPPPHLHTARLAGEGKQYQMWRLFFFFSALGYKELAVLGAGGCVALHRPGGLFIEMEEEGAEE